MVDDKEKDDEIDIEIVDDGTEIDESTPGDGIELNDDLFEDKSPDNLEDNDADSDEDEDEDNDLDEDERKKMGKRAQKRIKQLLSKQRELQAQLAERDTKLTKVAHDKDASEYSEYERSVELLENREKEL